MASTKKPAGAKALAISLPQRAGWVEPLPFTSKTAPPSVRAHAARALRAWRSLGLSNLMIRRLVQALPETMAAAKIAATWPTIGDFREELEDVQQLMVKLATAIDRASPLAEAELATAALVVLKDAGRVNALKAELTVLSAGVGARLAKLPAQSRRTSHIALVRRVAEIAGPLNLAVSPREGTPFFRVCQAAFELAGVRQAEAKKGSNKKRSDAPPSPAASIRAFIAERQHLEKTDL